MFKQNVLLVLIGVVAYAVFKELEKWEVVIWPKGGLKQVKKCSECTDLTPEMLAKCEKCPSVFAEV